MNGVQNEPEARAPDGDLLAELGVELPEAVPRAREVGLGHKPPRLAPVRHTEWSNAQSFTFEGYLARVRRTRCECCDATSEVFEGVFTEEVKPNGTRRLQGLSKGAQWPQGVEHRLEVVDGGTTALCALCVRDIGFSRETAAPTSYSLVVPG